MGQPDHYSLDLPARCLRLLEELQPCASGIFMPGQDQALGPLTATFTLTMAIPIITLPCERIFKPNGDGNHYADDRALNEDITGAVQSQMKLQKLSLSLFCGQNAWSFVKVDNPDGFNLAEGLPPLVAERLAMKTAFDAAANMPVSQWISCLRNALAHGGIAYLDKDGMPSYGNPVENFALVSGRYDRTNDTPKLIGLNVLRIRQADFVQFLRDWVHWLQRSGIKLETAA